MFFLQKNKNSQYGFKNPLALASADDIWYISQQFVEKQGVWKSNLHIRYETVTGILD